MFIPEFLHLHLRLRNICARDVSSGRQPLNRSEYIPLPFALIGSSDCLVHSRKSPDVDLADAYEGHLEHLGDRRRVWAAIWCPIPEAVGLGDMLVVSVVEGACPFSRRYLS